MEHRANLKRRTLYWAERIRVTPKVIRVQSMTRKWGSCSTSGIITLAIDLAEEDPAFQDYVIAHELLHLKVPSHGRVFKALMSVYVPSWRQYGELPMKDWHGGNICEGN